MFAIQCWKPKLKIITFPLSDTPPSFTAGERGEGAGDARPGGLRQEGERRAQEGDKGHRGGQVSNTMRNVTNVIDVIGYNE